MTRSDALRKWLANGCRQDDPVLAEVGAVSIYRGDDGEPGACLFWRAATARLRLEAWPRLGFEWVYRDDEQHGASLGFRAELPPAFWSHLARITGEGT